MALNEQQVQAVELMQHARVGVVTGGPGTGKTYSLAWAVDELIRAGQSFALCAPTGKAARRMSEATAQEAHTLHRYLRIAPNPRGGPYELGERRECDPGPPSVLIVDEASMVDLRLFEALLRERPPWGRLIMMGDADQLPSIGAGQVLRDLVDARSVPTVRLLHANRYAEESWVYRNAPRILDGQVPELEPCPGFRFIEADSTIEVAVAVRAACMDDPEAQVLAPQHSTPCGVSALNQALQVALNGQAGLPEVTIDNLRLRLGDKVVQVKNDYELGIRNGDVGRIIDIDEHVLTVAFDGDLQPTVFPTLARAEHLRLAYAMTVHKSQGSEWPHCIVVCHNAHSHMLTRSLLYTAVTRAKQRLTLIGNRAGLRHAVGHGADPRNTLLRQRIDGEV